MKPRGLGTNHARYAHACARGMDHGIQSRSGTVLTRCCIRFGSSLGSEQYTGFQKDSLQTCYPVFHKINHPSIRWNISRFSTSYNVWFNFTCNHAPRAHPRGFVIFSFLQKVTIPHHRAPDRPYIHFLLHLFDPYKSETTRFHNFYERFPEFTDRRIRLAIM